MRFMLSGALVLIQLFIFGCAATPNRQAIGTKYTSDIPPLEVEFAYKIGNVENKRDSKFITLYTTEVRNIWVEIERIGLTDSRSVNYHSFEKIADYNNFIIYEPIYFENHKWAKVSNVTENGYLVCGYMTRKDKWMIFIHNSYKLDKIGVERYRGYGQISDISESDKQFIENLFVDLDKAIISIR